MGSVSEFRMLEIGGPIDRDYEKSLTDLGRSQISDLAASAAERRELGEIRWASMDSSKIRLLRGEG